VSGAEVVALGVPIGLSIFMAIISILMIAGWFQ
jgi:hypothetical protein